MRITAWASALALGIALAGCTAPGDAPAPRAAAANTATAIRITQPPARNPADLEVLFWTDAQRAERFRDMEGWFAGHEVPAAAKPRALPRGAPLPADLQAALQTLMDQTNAAGIMVLQNGKVRYEAYGLGFGPQARWTSFSVAKSFTATLLGAAIEDGFITSLDDPVTNYIPGLKGSAYEGVTVRQLATMTSGVKWNEDYADPQSDVAQMNAFVLQYGGDAIVEQMKRLPREAEPGKKWVYKTGETNLIGLLVENAVGKPLAAYAKAKIVDPAGFEGGLFWMVGPGGGNIGGCCLSIRLADYARMGQFALEGGKGVVGEGWFTEAGRPQVDFGPARPGFGYGYQWWTYPGGNYGAQGIFGQSITIVPSKQLVIAYLGNWPKASGGPERLKVLAVSQRIAAGVE